MLITCAEPHQGDLNLGVDDGPSFSSRDDDFPDESPARVRRAGR